MEVTSIQVNPQLWNIKLGRKIVGQMRESKMGFRYCPRGSQVAGEFFPTFAACLQSLRETDL
jgi:hypothetical protein